MTALKKFVDTTCFSAPGILKTYFQTIRSIKVSSAAATTIQGLDLKTLNYKPGHDLADKLSSHKIERNVADILQTVKFTDGLPTPPSHVEHIIGRATKTTIHQNHNKFKKSAINFSSSINGGKQHYCPFDIIQTQEENEVGEIDIAEKTRLILQSPHPVRYVIERELYNSQQDLHLRFPSYHTWIMIFGRSLIPQSIDINLKYDKLLDYIANASDAGMFSAAIHNTIIDIPENHPSFYNCSTQFYMGNKYAVLVGDYFAIRCIYYAARTKTNSVMAAITEGVEEFTTSTFGTNLIDKNVGFPMLLSSAASVYDWIIYNQKAFGYFKGGLYAAFSLKNNQQQAALQVEMTEFVDKFSAFLKACEEIKSLKQCDLAAPSPFLLMSLPAILYQTENPAAFSRLRKMGYDLNAEHIRELHSKIRKHSVSMKRSRSLAYGFASEAKQSLRKIANNLHYIDVFESLIDAVGKKI